MSFFICSQSLGVALPNGIQLVARRFHEAEALAAAAVVERALGWVRNVKLMACSSDFT